jgi:hypothetical protein
MSNKFTLLLDHLDSQTKVIACKEKGLYIKVYPRKKGILKFDETDLVLTALFYFRDPAGEAVKEECAYIDFVIKNSGSAYSREWNVELFYDAIDFYCREHLKIEHDGIQHSAHLMWYGFDDEIKDYDEFDCISPTNVRHAIPGALQEMAARQISRQ